MRAAAVLAATLTLGVAGCSAVAPRAAGPATPPALPGPPPLPASWSYHTAGTEGFAVATPDAWEAAVRDSPSRTADLEGVANRSPGLAAFFQKALDSNPELRLVAADPRTLAQGFAANVNVMTANLGAVAAAPTLADIGDAKLSRLQTEVAVRLPVRRAGARLSGQPAVRLDYSLRVGDHDIAVRSYLVVVDRDGQRRRLELTMGATGDQDAAATFDGISQSFSLAAA